MNPNHSIDVEALRQDAELRLKSGTIGGGMFHIWTEDFIAILDRLAKAEASLGDRRTPVSGEVAEGFVLVPRKPTPEMLNALYVTPDFVGSTIIRHSVDKLPAAYEAMLAVAPLPVPRMGGNTNHETPQISAQGIDHAKRDIYAELMSGFDALDHAKLAEDEEDDKFEDALLKKLNKWEDCPPGYHAFQAWGDLLQFLRDWKARGQQAGGTEDAK